MYVIIISPNNYCSVNAFRNDAGQHDAVDSVEFHHE